LKKLLHEGGLKAIADSVALAPRLLSFFKPCPTFLGKTKLAYHGRRITILNWFVSITPPVEDEE
jgi:hypothetical protein